MSVVVITFALWGPFVLLALASVWDFRKREIPDAIPMALLLWTMAAHVWHATPVGWISAGEGLALGLALGIAAFQANVIGGGDAKLLAALGALLGPLAFAVFLLFASVAGGLLAIVARLRGERDLAYAPAFALGWLGLVLLR